MNPGDTVTFGPLMVRFLKGEESGLVVRVFGYVDPLSTWNTVPMVRIQLAKSARVVNVRISQLYR